MSLDSFDSNLEFKKQISTFVKGSFHQIHNLSKVKPCLFFNDLENVIHAFMSCRRDYCNSLYVGLDQSSLCRLQLAQNTAACLLTGTKKREHITPILASLHWLPIHLAWPPIISWSSYKLKFCQRFLIIQRAVVGCPQIQTKN